MTRVLIVDDEPRDLFGLHAVLRSCDGVEIELAGSGAEAVLVAEAFMPEVVILDFKMPEMSGPEASLLLRQVCPAAHIIAVSAHIDGAADWADGFIRKDHLQHLPALLDIVVRDLTHASLKRSSGDNEQTTAGLV
jgi:CheY-like chemotaxis protein